MKVKVSLVFLSLFFLLSCGDSKPSNLNGVSYDIYDSRSFLELDNPNPIDYGCLNLKKKPGQSLVGEEEIDLVGPNVTLRWTRSDESITFTLFTDHDQISTTHTLEYFSTGGAKIISLRTEEDREITVELMGSDC